MTRAPIDLLPAPCEVCGDEVGWDDDRIRIRLVGHDMLLSHVHHDPPNPMAKEVNVKT